MYPKARTSTNLSFIYNYTIFWSSINLILSKVSDHHSPPPKKKKSFSNGPFQPLCAFYSGSRGFKIITSPHQFEGRTKSPLNLLFSAISLSTSSLAMYQSKYICVQLRRVIKNTHIPHINWWGMLFDIFKMSFLYFLYKKEKRDSNFSNSIQYVSTCYNPITKTCFETEYPYAQHGSCHLWKRLSTSLFITFTCQLSELGTSKFAITN